MAILSPPAQLPDEAQPAEPQQQPVKRQITLWLWPVLITLAATMYKINEPVMGNDELATWEVARRSTGQIMATLHNVDAVHGTYYLFMHGWMTVFGDSPTAMRTPSALAMAAAASLVALTGRRLFGARAGLCAGLLFAIVPAVSRFGQESRGYALVVLAATLATLLLLRALDAHRSAWRWGAYAACLACIGLLHLVALTIVAAHAVLVLARARYTEPRVLWSFVLAAFVGTACVTPVIALGLSHDDRQLFWVPEPTLWSLLEIGPQIFASGLCAGAVFVLAVLARSERREGLLLCAALAVLPFLEIWIASQGEVSYFRYQYALFTLPAWAMLAGAGLASVTRSGGAAIAALFLLALFALPDHEQMREQYEHDVPHRVDYESAAGTIAKYHLPGDAVVFGRGYAWMLGGGVRYYLPDDKKLRETLVVPGAVRDDLYSMDCPDPAQCLGSEKRVWVVVEGRTPAPLASIAAAQAKVLRAEFKPAGSVQHTGVTVELHVRKPR
ncbi:glycosyltransferase family 39 protein [Streptomyces sp. NPDC096176]|uniref:glycosyltransferase family 39 protein n=1 Tax=Streptomyces sp. NPDC096176 TaxID=3366079 RepID=UPI00380D1BB5